MKNAIRIITRTRAREGIPQFFKAFLSLRDLSIMLHLSIRRATDLHRHKRSNFM
jgi:hypothetical protein